MVGGVISDIYHAEHRNTPMALFAGAALFGTGLGPLISSNIVSHTTWRWVYWSHGMVNGAFVVIMYFCLSETRGSILLSRKAHALNKWYESCEAAGYYGVVFPSDVPEKRPVRRIRWKVKADEERESIFKMISISCYRPFRMYIHVCLALHAANDVRPAGYGAGGVFLFPLDIVQLGRSVPPARLYPAGHGDQPLLYRSPSRRRLYR
jgi:MFS family permease